MKKLFLSLTAISLAGSAQAALVAGWDFSQYVQGGENTIDGANYVQSLSANYSSFTGAGLGVLAAPFGTFFYDGTNGSSNIANADAGPVDGSLNSNLDGTGNINGFDSHGFLNLAGQPNTLAMQYAIGNPFSVVFKASLSSLSLQANNWSLVLGAVNAGFGDGASTVAIESSTNGTSYISEGVINLTAVDSLFTVTPSNVTSGGIYFRLTTNEPGTFIDNVAINATTVAIPEPSTYSAIAGVAILGLALVRRRRRAA